MKKLLVTMIAAVLILAMGVGALASYSMYVNKDGVKVYKKADKDSKVITKLNGNDKVSVVDEIGGWSKVSVKVNGSKTSGWVQNKYLSDSPVPSKCKHKWSSWEVIKEPTCTHKGYRQRFCKKCGIMEEGDIPKTGHSFGSWHVMSEPTCTEKGVKARTCRICGYRETKDIPKTGHDFGKWKVTKEATCTKQGERTRTCRNCGYKEKEKYLAPHEYGSWKVTRQPTCSQAGEKVRTCVNCGKKETQSIDKLPHDFEYDVIVEATDHSAGIRAKVCRVCGYTTDRENFDPEGTLRRGDRGPDVRDLQQELADQGFLNAGGVDSIYGGATEKAVMQFQMRQGLYADGVAWPQTQKRLSHDFGPWEVVKELTRTEPGERARTCVDCGYQQREKIELSPYFVRKDRGESIRAIQQMLSQLGYSTGSFDGIYGPKLDTAFTSFEAAHRMSFIPGQIRPVDVDTLTKYWIDSISPLEWKGEGSTGTPVNLALTVTPASDSDQNANMRTYNWTLTNMGTQKCMFNALLLCFGDDPDYAGDTMTMVIDGIEMKPNFGNTASGTFTACADWGEGNMNFAAMAVSETTNAKWLSNTVVFEYASKAAAKTVEPMAEEIDVNNLSDGIYPVSFNRGDVLSGASGVFMNGVHVYTEDVYDTVDISTLNVGDTIVIYGEPVEVTSIERGDAVRINGGLIGGGYDLVTREAEDTNGYFVNGDDDLSAYTDRGVTTLVLDSAATYTDSSDIEGEPVTASGSEIVAAMQSSDNEFFDQYNTTVRIEAGKVVEINRVYVP